MKELKGKAEFFQQYIMDRFRKLREQRSIGTNTESEDSTSHAASIEQLVQDCDEALAAKVCTSCQFFVFSCFINLRPIELNRDIKGFENVCMFAQRRTAAGHAQKEYKGRI